MKNTNEILDSNKAYFKNLKGTMEIVVLGQSLGMADWPYFKKIQKMLPYANWKISYYSNQEKQAMIDIAVNTFKISQDKIQMIKMEEL